jgi:hypothetical protein
MYKKHVLAEAGSPSSKAAAFYDARSVQPVREPGKKARTPLAAFFNIPEKTNLIWRAPTTEVGPNSKGG